MPIGDGTRIKVKFTQPLIGNAEETNLSIDNKEKFKVSFDRYEYVPDGALVKAERSLESIEIVSTFDGNVDLSKGVNDNIEFKDDVLKLKTVMDESNYEIKLVNKNESSSNSVTTCSLTMSNCTVGNVLVLAYAIRGDGNDPTLTDGWVKLGGGNNDASPDLYHKLYFAYKVVENANETITVTQTTTSRIYLVCSEYSGVKEVVMRNDLAVYGANGSSVLAIKTNESEKIIYAVTTSLYTSGRDQTVSPTDITKIQGSSDAERLACWFDNGSGALEHTFTTYSSSSDPAVIECVELKGHEKEYFQNGQSEFVIENLTSLGTIINSAIHWEFDEPENTIVKVFAKTGNEEYAECSNDSEIPSLNVGLELANNSFQVKVELSTNDIYVTPSFKGLTILLRTSGEENYIVLVLPKGNINSFQNAIGDITVSYDGSGTLMGLGGTVAAFEKIFTPTDLDYKEDQNDAEHIEITNVTANPILTKVFYKNFDSGSEHLEIVGVSATATLMNVDDI